ncbi:hypothetical protein EU528_08300 [Candidatus Thorarchaeota archaeon]|nr:MAG: hypothetical protein EU528_08300 [Candidatus Thorarchaeota archaeon]
MRIICPKCGNEYKKGDKCPKCGHNWKTPIGGQIVVTMIDTLDDIEIICRNCHYKYPLSRDTCPKCGLHRDRIICKKCETEFPASAGICPTCGESWR